MKPEHFVIWAKQIFDSYFVEKPLKIKKLLETPEFLRSEEEKRLIQEFMILEDNKSVLTWANHLYSALFGNEYDEEEKKLFINSTGRLMGRIVKTVSNSQSVNLFDKVYCGVEFDSYL